VSQVLKEAEAEVGAPVKLASFVRFVLGEGIEKDDGPDFAAEVAAQSRATPKPSDDKGTQA